MYEVVFFSFFFLFFLSESFWFGKQFQRGYSDNVTTLVVALEGWAHRAGKDYTQLLHASKAEELFGKTINLPSQFIQRSSLERSKVIEELFIMFDTSGDGKLNREEVRHGMSVLGQEVAEEAIDEIFLSSASDGLISKEGRVAHTPSHPVARNLTLVHCFLLFFHRVRAPSDRERGDGRGIRFLTRLKAIKAKVS